MLEGKQKIKHKRGGDDLLVTVLHGIQRRWHWSKAFWDMMVRGTEHMSELVLDWQSQVMASTGIGQKVKQLG